MNKLKKRIIFIVLVFSVVKLFAISTEYELNNVKNEYLGTYIPVDLELRLYQSKKFYESLRASRKYGEYRPHDVLYLRKNICYSNSGFHDGYAIKTKEFVNYKFINDKGGIFCIDDKGYLYRKIGNSESGYKEYVEYVMKIIFSNSSDIKILDDQLIIDDKKYEVNLDGNFFDIKNAAIWLFNDGHYVLEKKGIDGELYTGKEAEDRFENIKDILIKRIPGIFKVNPNELPDYSKVSKENLRLFRNLIYARNGYTFKSIDLQEFFNSCSWYKSNPNFNEAGMRKDEKDFIGLMKDFEAKCK